MDKSNIPPAMRYEEALKSLDPKTFAFFQSLGKFVTNAERNKIPTEDENVTLVWDGFVLLSFIDRTLLKDEISPNVFFDDLKKYGIPTAKRTIRNVKSEGVGANTILKVFYFAGEYLGYTLSEYLAIYVQSKKENNFVPKSFSEHPNVVSKLRKVEVDSGKPALRVDTLQDLSIADQILYEKEYEALKKDLHLYPYVKNRIPAYDPANTEAVYVRVEKSISTFGNFPELLILKARLLVLRDKSEGLRLSQEIFSTNSNDLNIIDSHISVLISAGSFESVLEVVLKAINRHSNNVRLELGAAIAYEKLGRIKEAIERYVKVIQLDTEYVYPYCRLAVCFQLSEQYEESIFAVQKALKILPREDKLHHIMVANLSVLYGESKAVPYLEKIVENNETDSKLFKVIYEISNFDKFIEKESKIKSVIAELEKDIFETKFIKFSIYCYFSGVLIDFYKNYEPNERLVFYAMECANKAKSLKKNSGMVFGLYSTLYFLQNDYINSRKYLDLNSELIESWNEPKPAPWEPFFILANEFHEGFRRKDYAKPLEWGLEKYGREIEFRLSLVKFYIKTSNRECAEDHLDYSVSAAERASKQNNPIARAASLLLAEYMRLFSSKWPSRDDYLAKAIEFLDLYITPSVEKENFDLWYDYVFEKGCTLILIGQRSCEIDNFKKAADLYEALLSRVDRFKYPEKWSDINSNLSIAFENIGRSENNHEALKRSVKHQKAVLESIPLEDEFYLSRLFEAGKWVKSLGMDYLNKGYLIHAIEMFHLAAGKVDRASNENLWGSVNIQLAQCYYKLNEIEPDFSALEDAKKYYCNSASISRENWQLDSLLGLGVTLTKIGKITKDTKTYRQSIIVLKKALRIVKKDDYDGFIHVQLQIGFALQDLALLQSNKTNLLTVVELFRFLMRSLDENGRKSEKQYQYSCHNFATCIIDLYGLDKKYFSLLDEAHNALGEAEEMQSDDQETFEYAHIQANIADILLRVGTQNKDKEKIMEAVSRYKLSVNILKKIGVKDHIKVLNATINEAEQEIKKLN